LKLWLRHFLVVVWASFLLLTSLYCLLAFLPYTFYALIKAPAYDWMPWAVRYYAFLYWMALAGLVWARWSERKRPGYALLFGLLSLMGIFITVHPVIPTLQSNLAAYAWSVGSLIPIIVLGVLEVFCHWPRGQDRVTPMWSYPVAAWVAIMIATLATVGAKIRIYVETRSAAVHALDFELAAWSLVSHVVLAMVVACLFNLLIVLAARTAWPRMVRYAGSGLAVFAGLSFYFSAFLDDALSFSGWPARLYGALLAAALVLLALALAVVWISSESGRLEKSRAVGTSLVAACILSILALIVPSVIGDRDWNDVLQSAFTLLLWLGLSICLFVLQRRRQAYSVPAILAVLLISCFSYKLLQSTEIFWAKALGSTDDDIGRAEEQYASQNTSFQFAHHLLGNAPRQKPCGELCRLLREHTNIRDATIKTEIRLASPLARTSGPRPNVFVLVIDSLRPDYIGAYNPNVDFTPNIDTLARDSAVFRRAYTQYAGTTLSEPAIWSGALLLHAHYVRPFSNVNSLERLLDTDGYKMVVSFDTVLEELLTPKQDMVKLDTDKTLWNQFELCSTVEQMATALDGRTDKTQPVFFYAQPMNVHMFAHNHQPTWKDTNWGRPGFNNRIALEVHQVDQCIGNFVSYLKTHGLYDESIIILTSDHGDATGELGRRNHSYIIYPEVMHVPLIVHLPKSMRQKLVHDANGVVTLTDITPSLYYLLGHRPVLENPLFGRPLFAETQQELAGNRRRNEVFLASDDSAVYGFLDDGGRYMYVTYDSPERSFLFDLARDPNAQHSILTEELKRRYDQRILDYLRMIADFYGYKPGVGQLFASRR
jgi:arylsulfatase A-like enzyme